MSSVAKSMDNYKWSLYLQLQCIVKWYTSICPTLLNTTLHCYFWIHSSYELWKLLLNFESQLAENGANNYRITCRLLNFKNTHNLLPFHFLWFYTTENNSYKFQSECIFIESLKEHLYLYNNLRRQNRVKVFANN